MEADTIVARVKQALEQVRMWKRRKTAPNHLSGGQKQRIAISGILAMNPFYIVLDEPSAMVDPKGRKEVMEALQRLNQEQEMTVILITHDMEEAALASRVILLADGQMRFDGRPEKFFGADALLAEMGMEAPLSYRVQQAMGSAANLQSGAGEKRDKCKIDALDKFEKDKDLLSLQHVSYIYSPGTAYEKVALDDVNL